MDDWYFVFFYAAVVAVLVRAVTKEDLFREPRRRLTSYAQDETRPALLRKLAYMPTCEFCCSFWVALVLVAGVFQYRLLLDDARGYLVSVLTTMGVANVYMGLFDLLRVDLHKERAVTEHLERRRTA